MFPAKKLTALGFLAAATLMGSLTTGCVAEEQADDEASDEAITMGTRPWDDQAEVEWATFVQKIGEARASGRCTSVNACLNDASINPLKKPGDGNLNVFADCADLPMELRAYFAAKTGRPFQFVSTAEANEGADVRYGKGIHPVAFRDMREFPTLQGLMSGVSASVHSGMFRMAGDVEATDTYPIDVTKDSVKPGVVFYDPNGHVLIVYKVEADGTVRLMDGHPDNSLTFGILSEKFAVGGAAQGGGFRKFRPIAFDGRSFTRTPNARLTGSKYAWSATAQYGKGRGYYDWVRERLSNGAPMQPEQQFKELTTQLCSDLGDRATAVAGAARVANGNLGAVPPNIYGASGEWEELSTPSRDARLKASFRGIATFIKETRTLVDQRSSKIAFAGSSAQLTAKYKETWAGLATSCKITYKNSAGAAVTLTLADVEARLFDLSFDPYHCVEMRWGAHPTKTAEMASCRTSAAHMQRFADERKQRNAIDREYGAPTPFSWGPEQPEDVNVSKLLRSL